MVTRTELTQMVIDLEKRLAAHEKATVRISVKQIAGLYERIAILEKTVASQAQLGKPASPQAGKD